MATYGVDADVVLDWTPRKLRILSESRYRRERAEKLWQIAIARIPGLADQSNYVEQLMADLMSWDEYVDAQTGGAPRIDEMSDEQLHALGVHVVDGASNDKGSTG